MGLNKDTPSLRAVTHRPSPTAKVVALPRVGGLHHRYEWREAASVSLVARVTRLVAEKFVLSTFPRALTTLSSMCSRAVRALESSPGLIMMMDKFPSKLFPLRREPSTLLVAQA